jgi:anti-sigma factor (TIGR02949 family)
MSGHEHMDCQEALDRLYEFLDGELTPDAATAIREHLEACAGCVGLYDFERAYLRFLEARTRTVGAPAHVRRRILHDLFGEEAQTE